MLRVNRLIIIGAPSLAGKTFLVNKLQQGDCPNLCEQLGIRDPSSWRFINANSLKDVRQTDFERLVVHYDMYAQQSGESGFSYLRELISNADRVVIVTVKASREILLARANARLLECLFDLVLVRGKEYRFRKNWGLVRRQRQKRKAYKQGESDRLYERWFDYLNQFTVTSHWLFEGDESHALRAYPYNADGLEYSDVNG